MKYFDVFKEQKEEFDFSSSVLAMEDASFSEKQLTNTLNAFEVAVEQMMEIKLLIDNAENELRKEVVTDGFVTQYVTSLEGHLLSVGYPTDSLVAIESASTPREELQIALEKSKSIFTEMYAGMYKRFATLEKTFTKWFHNFGKIFDEWFQKLEERKSQLEDIKKTGKKPTTTSLTETNPFADVNMFHIIALFGYSNERNVVKSINSIIDTYATPDVCDKVGDLIASSVSQDTKLKHIIDNAPAIKMLESQFMETIAKIFCKSDKGDYSFVGIDRSAAYIFKRCKPLRIKHKLNNYMYSVKPVYFTTRDFFGQGMTIDIPDLDDLIKLVDRTIEVKKKRKSIENAVFDVLSMGSEQIHKVDKEMEWEGVAVYYVIPQILKAVVKTVYNIPGMTDALATMYVKTAKADNK